MKLTGIRGLFFVCTGLVLGVFLPACRNTAFQGPVVAQVGEQKITAGELKTRLQEASPDYQHYVASPEGRRQFLNLLIREKVLLQESRRLGIARDPAYINKVKTFKKEWARRLKDYEDTLQVESVIRVLRTKELAATDTDVETYYAANRAEYEKPVEVLASHILVPSEPEAQLALDRLKTGEPFEKVARSMSKDPSTAVRGGKLSPFRKGALVPEFEEAVFKLKVGEISGIVKTQFGFHIIRKLGEKQVPGRSLPEVKEEIRTRLERDKFNQWVSAKQAALGVQVNEQAIASLAIEESAKP